MKLSKILIIFKIIILVAIPFLYIVIKIEPNIIFDILWVVVFALLTKEFILKIVLKKRYCDISTQNQSK